MSDRYLMILRDQPDPTPAKWPKGNVPHGWREAFRSPLATVFVTAATTITRLDSDKGMIVGPIFSKGSRNRITHMDAAQSADVSSQNAARLVADYWGGYVAIFKNIDAEGWHVVRDPSGALPCFFCRSRGTLIASSDVETLLASGLCNTSIDWRFLHGHLQFYDLRTEDTALTGIKELRPGFQLRSARGAPVRRQVWSPWDFADRPKGNDADLAANLRETVMTCVQAWASQFGEIVLGLSGGLDSSVIAACLASQSTRWSTFTMVTADATGDERRYASAMATHVNTRLLVGTHDLANVDIGSCRSAHLPRPKGFGFGQSQDKVVNAMAASSGADAHFAGIGGDNVFCLMTSATPIADRFLAGGTASEIWETTLDVCRLTSCSVLEAVSGAMAKRFRPRPRFGHIRVSRFLREHGETDACTDFSHPWLNLPKSYLPGKAVHIAMLARIHGTSGGYDATSSTPLILPLLPQPILEACLAIPSWTWCAGGVNRAVVRQAFSKDLPQIILQRTSKGGPEGFCANLLDFHRTKILTFLQDGLLAKHDLLDLAALRLALGGVAPLAETDLSIIAKLVEAEAWCRHWTLRLQDLAN